MRSVLIASVIKPQSLMPPVITTVVIAETYKLDVEFTTLLLTVLTPISIIVSIAVGYLIV